MLAAVAAAAQRVDRDDHPRPNMPPTMPTIGPERWHHRRVFRDRQDAGDQLAGAVSEAVQGPAVVLGIPRGGVIVAAPVAAVLDAPLDVVVPRKLGAPGNPELAIGAVAPGIRVVDEHAVRVLSVSPAYLEAEVARQELEIDRRSEAYRGGRPAPRLRERTVVVVDDGVATGATAMASLRWARAQGAARVLFAAPVGPSGIEERLSQECDRCIVLVTPAHLRAVGQWYERFDEVSDEQVGRALGTP